MKAPDYDLIIAGAGLAGLSLAAALRDSGRRIALLDAAKPAPVREPLSDRAPWDSRIYAVSPGSVEFLRSAGAWAGVNQNRVGPCDVMDIAAGTPTQGHVRLSAFDAGVPALALIVEADQLARALADCVLGSAHPPECRFSADLAQVEQGEGRCIVHLASGERLETALLVGADGARSAVRTLTGLHARRDSYEMVAIVANLQTDLPHGGVAWQWFQNAAVLAWLPLPGAVISIVWSLPHDEAARLLKADDDAFCAELAEVTGGPLGGMRLISARRSFPLERIRVDSITGERVALIGDAAHTIHPLAGQGINLGFRDVRALAGLLMRTAAPARAAGVREAAGVAWPTDRTDWGDRALLRRYRQVRAEDILAHEWLTHGLQRLFARKDGFSRVIRNTGLNLLDRMPVIKGMLAKYALD